MNFNSHYAEYFVLDTHCSVLIENSYLLWCTLRIVWICCSSFRLLSIAVALCESAMVLMQTAPSFIARLQPTAKERCGVLVRASQNQMMASESIENTHQWVTGLTTVSVVGLRSALPSCLWFGLPRPAERPCGFPFFLFSLSCGVVSCAYIRWCVFTRAAASKRGGAHVGVAPSSRNAVFLNILFFVAREREARAIHLHLVPPSSCLVPSWR